MSEQPRDRPRYWRHPGMPGVELVKAHFVRHAFGRHTHETYTFAVIESGIEEYAYRGATRRVGSGGIAVVEPDEVHTGQAGVPEGWRYRVLYPDAEVVARAARDLGMPAPPGFCGSERYDPGAAALLRSAHLATERGDSLSASTLTRQALHCMLGRYGRARPDAPQAAAGDTGVERARELLHTRMVDPPSLEDLAAAVDTPPYTLLRAFRARHGLPPHAYLNNERVLRARRLLATGRPPGDVAALVGFADQPHLTRHFKRHLGVTPGAYQRQVGAGGTAGFVTPR